jgi:Protein of unknown function (DUF1194)
MTHMPRLLLLMLGATLALARPAGAQEKVAAAVDLALVLAVDISNSINPAQFELQMDGLAQAFEDQAVQDAIVSGRHAVILVTIVAWSDKPRIAIPWTPIASELEAVAFGERIRDLPRIAGNFTCMADALNFIEDRVLPLQPVPAERQIIDVSGDGRENCNPRKPLDVVRSELVAGGVTINGLPILEGAEADQLEQWYTDNVIGGPFAFVLPAEGYNDFARAIRRKFLVEISMASRSRLRANDPDHFPYFVN